MQIAVQTRPWGPEMNREHLEQVLDEVAAAGYDGIEIGAQHLDLNRPAAFGRLLSDRGLQLAAVHVGGEIYDPRAVREAMANLERAISFAAAAGAAFLAFSGKAKTGKSDAEFCFEAESLNTIGEVCRENGLALVYHNHYWEIADGCRELHYLCDHTDAALVSLCLDVAWVWRGGADPVAVAREFLPRIGYLHLKDSTAGEWRELGYGSLDLAGLRDAVLHKRFAWAVVEQDETVGPALDSAVISRAYLREQWGV